MSGNRRVSNRTVDALISMPYRRELLSINRTGESPAVTTIPGTTARLQMDSDDDIDIVDEASASASHIVCLQMDSDEDFDIVDEEASTSASHTVREQLSDDDPPGLYTSLSPIEIQEEMNRAITKTNEILQVRNT